jgi:hypothetical protein
MAFQSKILKDHGHEKGAKQLCHRRLVGTIAKSDIWVQIREKEMQTPCADLVWRLPLDMVAGVTT